MALAPGHLLGQYIGNILEEAAEPLLRALAEKHDLYLDVHGERPGVRDGLKLTWSDDAGNTHDLDFVLERGANPGKRGIPAAFVETAWRRYTKHSKNKAQEIEAAVSAVIRQWKNVGPTPGAIVAGEWSRPALQQLRNSGFVVLHLNFSTTVAVFAHYGIDIAGQGENTPDDFWQEQVDALHRLTPLQRKALAGDLYTANKTDFDSFVEELESRIVRDIESITVLPLHGSPQQFFSVSEAVAGLRGYSAEPSRLPFIRFEIRIKYTNGDKIEASFGTAEAASRFLESFA